MLARATQDHILLKEQLEQAKQNIIYKALETVAKLSESKLRRTILSKR
jgi:hypothetical protein